MPNDVLLIENAGATLIETTAMETIRRRAVSARGTRAKNTIRAYKSDSAVFTTWCAAENRQAVPASPETVANFIDAMAATRSPATIGRYASTIARLHRMAEVANPCETSDVRDALDRMRRERSHEGQRQAAPLNDALVGRMLRAAKTPTLRNLRNRALVVVAYTTMARCSELVAIRFASLEVDAEGFGTVKIKRSKGDQEGRGADVPITPDAMRHLQAWIEAARIGDGPLFRAIRKGPRVRGAMGANDVALVFKAMARAAGLSSEEIAGISGHSTRVGAANDLLRFGEQLPSIMQAGRWKSPEMVSRYTAKQAARGGAAARIAHRREQF
jgi:site-specific recombinase XerD